MRNELIAGKRMMWILFGIALILRLLYITILEDKWYFYDTVHYHNAAVSLLEGNGFGESLFNVHDGPQVYALEPAYPLFLGAVYRIFGVSFAWTRVIQAVLTSLICMFLYRMIGRLFGAFAALAGATIAVFSPYLIFISGMLYPTALGTFFIMLVILLLVEFQQRESRGILFAGSLAYGIVVQIFPIVLLFVFFSSGWLLLRRKEKGRVLTDWTIWMLGILLMITPWTIRNYRIFNRIVPIRALTNTFENLQSSHELEKLYQEIVTGDTFTVETRQDDSKVYFDCYVNSSWVGTLHDSSVTVKDTYTGVLISGGVNARIDRFLAGSQDDAWMVQDHFDRSEPGQTWSTDSSTVLSEGALINREEKPAWGRVAINRNARNVDRVTVMWGEGTNNHGVNRAAIALLLDSESIDSADGYMVWRNPIGYLRLWRVEKGLPAYHVALVYENQKDAAPPGLSTYFNYFLRNPGDFLTKYMFELIHFWNPWPGRVSSSNVFSSNVYMWIGCIASTFLLLSALAGISTVPQKKWRDLLPMLLFIATFNLGYAFFMTQARYRIPIEPLMMVLSGHGIDFAVQKFRQRRNKDMKLR